jgi:hypothetical protein
MTIKKYWMVPFVITKYMFKFKYLFGPSENSSIMLDESLTDDIPQVSDLKNEYLQIPSHKRR